VSGPKGLNQRVICERNASAELPSPTGAGFSRNWGGWLADEAFDIC